MARHLPPTITLQPGSLVITGANATEILENLCLLAHALQNDLGTIQAMLDPPPKTPSVEQDELRAMFQRLREDEHAWAVRSPANLSRMEGAATNCAASSVGPAHKASNLAKAKFSAKYDEPPGL
jgi:hypothetical protein